MFCSATLTDLVPFTYYTFRVSACTAGVFAGCVTSDGVVVDTKMDMPEGQQQPTITALSSTVLYVEWEPPEHPNGTLLPC